MFSFNTSKNCKSQFVFSFKQSIIFKYLPIASLFVLCALLPFKNIFVLLYQLKCLFSTKIGVWNKCNIVPSYTGRTHFHLFIFYKKHWESPFILQAELFYGREEFFFFLAILYLSLKLFVLGQSSLSTTSYTPYPVIHSGVGRVCSTVRQLSAFSMSWNILCTWVYFLSLI